MMRECELCEAPARMYCESDQASLCWDCDEKVHCANFLVARHTRVLLCHSCQSPTPWKASGSKLGHTISVCERCVKRCDKSNGNDDDDDEESRKEDSDDDDDQFHDADENDDEETDDEDEIDETDEDDDEDEDADNQVVPWSSTPPPPPIPSCSSSNTDESSSSSRLVVCNGRDFSTSTSTVGGDKRNIAAAAVSLPLKRMREKLDLSFHQDDEIGCSPSPSAAMEVEEEVATSVISFRPLKDRKVALTTSNSTTLIGSLKRFEQKIVSSKEIEESSESILAICKLSKDPTAI